jgi:hypothetical protein
VPIRFSVLDALSLAAVLAVIAYAFDRGHIEGGVFISLFALLAFVLGYKTALVRMSRNRGSS